MIREKKMKISKLKMSKIAGLALISPLLVVSPLSVQAKDQPADAAQKAAERLKGDFDSIPQFEAAVKDATKAGVTPQTIAESRLLFYCTNNVTAPLPDLIRQLQPMLPKWNEKDSIFFSKREELEGLISLAQALVADDANDEAGFEKSIKDAFWTSPELASLCRKAVESHRAKQRDANITLPMDVTIPVSNGGQTSLAQLVKDHKAVLLDFWASWCGPCMSLMDELRDRAHKLADAKIVVAGMNNEAKNEGGSLAQAKVKAETVRKSKKMDFPWLIEPADSPFSGPLEITSIPRAVLVSPEGKILFNGHPDDPALISALTKLDGRLAGLQ